MIKHTYNILDLENFQTILRKIRGNLDWDWRRTSAPKKHILEKKNKCMRKMVKITDGDAKRETDKDKTLAKSRKTDSLTS